IAGVSPAQHHTAAGELFHALDNQIHVEVQTGVARANHQVIQVQKYGDIIGHEYIPAPATKRRRSNDYPIRKVYFRGILADSSELAMQNQSNWRCFPGNEAA